MNAEAIYYYILDSVRYRPMDYTEAINESILSTHPACAWKVVDFLEVIDQVRTITERIIEPIRQHVRLVIVDTLWL